MVCVLVASKLNECDDNLTAIDHLLQYIQRQLASKLVLDNTLVPTFDTVVECERQFLKHFDWNFNFLLPIDFVRMHLGQGILFSNELKEYSENLPGEDFQLLKQELSRALTSEALSLSDIIVSNGACFLRKIDSSDIAASIIYFARKNIL